MYSVYLIYTRSNLSLRISYFLIDIYNGQTNPAMFNIRNFYQEDFNLIQATSSNSSTKVQRLCQRKVKERFSQKFHLCLPIHCRHEHITMHLNFCFFPWCSCNTIKSTCRSNLHYSYLFNLWIF